MARKILGWIACTPVPLTIQEIQQALTINTKRKEVPSKVLVGLDLVRLCGPIVEIIDEYVQFVHFTVKEYAPTMPFPLGVSSLTESQIHLQ